MKELTLRECDVAGGAEMIVCGCERHAGLSTRKYETELSAPALIAVI